MVSSGGKNEKNGGRRNLNVSPKRQLGRKRSIEWRKEKKGERKVTKGSRRGREKETPEEFVTIFFH